MAQRVTTILEDDLVGGKAAETIAFALDGKQYEIDLNKRNTARLRKTFAPYLAAGRRAGGRKRRAAVRTRLASDESMASSSASAPAAADVRAWAAANGFEVAPKGRISSAVIAEYLSATEA